MKNRINTIVELAIILVVVLSVAVVVAQKDDPNEDYIDQALTEEPPEFREGYQEAPEGAEVVFDYLDENGVAHWTFSGNMADQAEKNLYTPVREGLGFIDPEAMMSRCASTLYGSLVGSADEIYVDGEYYGTLSILVGCESTTNFQFRADSAGETFELQDKDGNYVSISTWLEQQ